MKNCFLFLIVCMVGASLSAQNANQLIKIAENDTLLQKIYRDNHIKEVKVFLQPTSSEPRRLDHIVSVNSKGLVEFDGTDSLLYDEQDRLVRKWHNRRGDVLNYSCAYANSRNPLTQQWETNDNGDKLSRQINYFYTPDSGLVRIEYRKKGVLRTMEFLSATNPDTLINATRIHYDSEGKRSSELVKYKFDNNHLFIGEYIVNYLHQYEYDVNGRIIKEMEKATGYPGMLTTYEYDNKGLIFRTIFSDGRVYTYVYK